MGNRMPQNSRNRKLSRAALCAVSGIALAVIGSAAVRAGDADDGGGDRPYAKFFNGMLNKIGLGQQEQTIEYQERPPLVVPPNRDLPAPTAAGSPSAKNAAWPSDPDAKKRADRKQKERSVLTGETATGPTSQPDGTQPSGVWDKMTSWTKSITGNNKESATFLHEPSRSSLTDPPVGYRTPSPSQPYGINGLADKGKSKSGSDKQADMINGQPAPK
jgi:hypothetical protein